LEAKPPEVTVSELRLLLQKHWQATGRKQKQIGETLHSEAGQLLTALKLYLSLLEEKLDNSSNADVLDILEKMDALLDEKTESIQTLVTDLRVDIMEDFGLPAAMKWKLDNSFSDSDVTVKTNIPETIQNDSKLVEQTFYYCFSKVIDELVSRDSITKIDVEVQENDNEQLIVFTISGTKTDRILDTLQSRSLLSAELAERMRLIQGDFRLGMNSHDSLIITLSGPQKLR